MDVGRFKACLFTRKIAYRVDHKTYFKQLHMHLGLLCTIEEIWMKVSKCWSFVNYTLLESLIRRLRFQDLKQEFSQYLKSLHSFQSNTYLRDFSKCYSPSKMEDNWKDMIVHFKLNWEGHTLEDLKDQQYWVNCEFRLPSCCSVLKDIMSGSLIVTWSLPKEIALHARNHLINSGDIMAFCERRNIISVNVDGIECKAG